MYWYTAANYPTHHDLFLMAPLRKPQSFYDLSERLSVVLTFIIKAPNAYKVKVIL